MKVEVVGKNGLEITNAMKEYAENKISKIEKYYRSQKEMRATVVCKVYSDHHKVEVTIPSKHFTLRTETSADDIYAAIDLSVDKLERQIRKFRTKVNRVLREREGVSEFFDTSFNPDKTNEELKQQKVIKTKEVKLVPLSEDEAIDSMDASDHDFYIYLDEETMKVNLLYRRKDGEIARIKTDK